MEVYKMGDMVVDIMADMEVTRLTTDQGDLAYLI